MGAPGGGRVAANWPGMVEARFCFDPGQWESQTSPVSCDDCLQLPGADVVAGNVVRMIAYSCRGAELVVCSVVMQLVWGVAACVCFCPVLLHNLT